MITALNYKSDFISDDLIILGASGFARELAWVASEATKTWNVLGFLDDRRELAGSTVDGIQVLGGIDEWIQYSQALFVVGIGNPRIRRTVVDRMQRQGKPIFAVLIHKSVVHSPSVSLGEGTVVMAGCVLSTNIWVGRHVVMNQSVSVAHDCQIHNFCTVAPQVALSGNVTLLECVEVGTGACIRQGLSIGKGAMAGMGAVVTRDIPDFELVVGSPASPLRKLEPF